MKYTSNKQIGALIKKSRKDRKVTQKQLALAAGTGLRFISELEDGKPTCEVDKVLKVLQVLGIEVILQPSKLDENE